ncbi:MAG: addiction module component CHP02574 family protein [Bacteroidia bacterium]
MNIQLISDSNGKTTGIFIPIEEWNELKMKFKGLEDEEMDIPAWQKLKIEQRLKDYRKKPKEALDFDNTIDEVDNSI